MSQELEEKVRTLQEKAYRKWQEWSVGDEELIVQEYRNREVFRREMQHFIDWNGKIISQ